MKWLQLPFLWFQKQFLTRAFASSWSVLSLSLVCFAIAGYYMMYQLFFFGIGLDKLATDRYEAETIAMKYEGVQWFRSRLITPESPLELTTHSIPELNLDRRPPGLELFIQLEGVDENNLDPSEQCATLIIEQRPTTKQNIVSEFPLQQVRQQRLHTEWLTSTPQPRWGVSFQPESRTDWF